MLWILALTIAIVAASTLALRFNALRFGVRVGREVRALWPPLTTAGSSAEPRPDPERSDVALPVPVERYLTKAIAAGRRPATTMQLEHGGTFRPKLDGGWLTIRGTQYVRAEPPAFVWWGRVRVAPGVWIDARDRFESGHGNMLVMMDSTFTLADSGGSAIDQGALLRWLAELVWLPTAFRSRRVTWTPVDSRRAHVRLRVDDLEVAGTFEFGSDDLPTGFRALRYRDLGNGESALTEFLGTMSDYRMVDGLLVPHLMIAYWKVDDEHIPYARFEVERIVYDEPLPT